MTQWPRGPVRTSADVFVVGAGLAGLQATRHLVEDGFDFTVPDGAVNYAVTRAVLESLCESQTPQGIVAAWALLASTASAIRFVARLRALISGSRRLRPSC